MSKKRKNDKISTEKDLAKLMEEVNKQNFTSIDELKDFMDNLMGQSLDNLPDRTDKKGRSQDLVYQAYEQPITKAKKLIKKALELDPNNAEAYNYLAGIETDLDRIMALYEKAIIAGEKTLGKKFFKENKGYFWGLLETRPYMRAKAGLAECLYVKNELDKAIEIYEEMLALNPNDNQGIRYSLSTLLLEKNDLTKFEQFVKKHEDEYRSVWKFNNALYHFKKFGKNAMTNKVLLAAHKGNKYVIDYLLGIKKLPEEPPQYMGIGDENEAITYVYGAWKVWVETDNALEWLYAFKLKRMKKN